MGKATKIVETRAAMIKAADDTAIRRLERLRCKSCRNASLVRSLVFKILDYASRVVAPLEYKASYFEQEGVEARVEHARLVQEVKGGQA